MEAKAPVELTNSNRTDSSNGAGRDTALSLSDVARQLVLEIKQENGWTQLAAANAWGVSQTQVSRISRGGAVSLDFLTRVCESEGISIIELFGRYPGLSPSGEATEAATDLARRISDEFSDDDIRRFMRLARRARDGDLKLALRVLDALARQD